MEDIDGAIDAARKAVDRTALNDPDRARWLSKLGNKLGRRFERTGEMEDIDGAIDAASKAVEATPLDHPDRAARLSSLGTWLGRRFERTGAMEDIERAINAARQAVEATPLNHPDRAGWLSNLGNKLGRQFERTGEMEDIDGAIDAASEAVEATPLDHLSRAGRLTNLGNWLSRRFEWTDTMEDIDQAIVAGSLAVSAIPLNHPDRAAILGGLGSSLAMRFERTGDVEDVDRAIDITSMAVDATPIDDLDRSGRLSNLGNCFGTRFERMGEMEDIDRAVDLARKAVEATPLDHPDRAAFLNNLGNRLGRRFESTGAIEDLDEAVEVASIAVDAAPLDHPNEAVWLNNLGIWLGTRFEQTGAMEDINRCVDVANKAVEATSRDHPNRARWLNNLGSWLGTRFERTGLMEDIDQAVDAASEAVEVISLDHWDRAAILNNLGNKLGTRYEQTGEIEDINRAIDMARKAVEATPLDHPGRAVWLNTLAIWVGTRFKQAGAIEDLNEAIEVASAAADVTSPDHRDQAGRLHNLGSLLRRRFERTGAVQDLNQSLLAFQKGWNCRTAPPSVRIKLARDAAAILVSQFNWEESSALLQDAVKLLPTVSPRSLQNSDKQHILADFVGLASTAAATTLNAGKGAHDALKLLELGRGVIAGLLLEMRTDISDLERKHPELAEEFVSLRDELDSPADAAALLTTLENASSVESRAKRRREAEKRFPIVLEEIRAKPGFQNFLLPPTADELKGAADPGPIIVINVSSYRCDAFLVHQHRPVEALELPNLRLKDIEENAKSLRTADPYRVQQTLEWLWDVAACPILDALGFKQPPSDDSWPHIWWIPTGQLSQLPFHAAGRHMKGSVDTVLDRVTSSYSSSIKALIYGRRHRDRMPTRQASENALLITVPGSGLPFALDEVKMLEKLCPFLKLNPVKPPPRRDEILAYLRTCKIFHFASHGYSNPLEPSESCLVLDGESNSITVANLRDCRLQENSPFLAYLSACSTKVNEAERLVDEEIHLVSACQLAGFRHVVGTLWEVSDKYCVDVARVLYETIRDEGMTDEAVCRGLHRAIKALRDMDIEMTLMGESYTAGDVKVDGDETSDGKVVIQQENNNQSDAKTASVHDILNADDVTSTLKGKEGQWTYGGKAEIKHGETITSRNMDDTVDASREQERSKEKPESGGDKPRQSNWGIPSGSPPLVGPLIWAAYIHAGV